MPSFEWHPNQADVIAAQRIGLQLTDLDGGQGYTQVSYQDGSVAGSRTPGRVHAACQSSQPWLADVQSPVYGINSLENTYSVVITFPEARDALTGARGTERLRTVRSA